MKTAQELLVDVIKQTSGRWFGIVHNNANLHPLGDHSDFEQTRLVKLRDTQGGCILTNTIAFYDFRLGYHVCIHPTELVAANIDGKTYDLRKDG